MRLNKIIQSDYTSFSLYYQIKLPLDLEISIPSDDPVRLVSAFVEEMDLSELYKTYGRIRKNQATPRQMLKLVIYAAMNRIYSSRCRIWKWRKLSFHWGKRTDCLYKAAELWDFKNPKIQKRHQQKRKQGVSRRQRQLYLSEWKGTDCYKWTQK